MVTARTAPLIRSSLEEAEMIRQMAKREPCTVSGYVLNIFMFRLEHWGTHPATLA